jgi:hypothetical protein
VARACEVNPNVLHRWKRELRDYGTKAFNGNGKPRTEGTQVAELERKVGRQAMEIDFLQRCLQHVEEAETAGVDYARLVYPHIEKEVSMATLIPSWRLCVLGQVSRRASTAGGRRRQR